ncbi:hypothetical protein AB0J52_08280 [Spirillospora sp. NPDC049652]
MKPTYLAVAAALATTPLFAAPAHAADHDRPYYRTPTYECLSLFTTRTLPATAFGNDCWAAPGSPVFGYFHGRLRLRSPGHPTLHCTFANLTRFPWRIVARGCWFSYYY